MLQVEREVFNSDDSDPGRDYDPLQSSLPTAVILAHCQQKTDSDTLFVLFCLVICGSADISSLRVKPPRGCVAQLWPIHAPVSVNVVCRKLLARYLEQFVRMNADRFCTNTAA